MAIRLIGVALVALLTNPTITFSSPFKFSYGGQLSNEKGAVSGPVKIELKFFRVSAGGDAVPVTPVIFENVPLQDGIFQVEITQLTAEELTTIFDGTNNVYVEVSDRTNNVTYPRQQVNSVPFALKVPVDETTLSYNAQGKLTVNSIPAASISGLGNSVSLNTGTSPGNLIKIDSNGKIPAVDGSQITNLTLPNTGTAGTYTKVTTDAAGRVTSGTTLGASDVPFASPGAIGSTTPNAGTFTTLTTTGNVGVGTSSPSQKLSVSGTIESTSGGFKFPDGSIMSSAAKLVGSGGGAASTPTSGCPTGYILVPGDTDYGTSDFCVMKYEGKFGDKGAESRAAGLPARGTISQTVAQASCRNLGPGYALINNSEWMTIAANVANVASNWSGGAAGSGALNRGHSDNSPVTPLAAVTDDNDPCNGTGQTCSSSTWNDQRRSHKLSNNNVVWDFTGNVWEWVDFLNYEDKPSAASVWVEYTAVSSSTTMNKTSLVPSNAQKSWWVNTWNGATNGIGQYFAGTNSTGSALLRGGGWADGANSGVFAASLGDGPSNAGANLGFRCIFRPASP